MNEGELSPCATAAATFDELPNRVSAFQPASHESSRPIGSSAALAETLYAELRKIAAAHFRKERAAGTLQPTAVAHEAYIRLANRCPNGWHSRGEFLAAASLSVRRVLTDHARSRLRKKRGGGMARISIEDDCGLQSNSTVDLIELDDALTKLAEISLRCAQVVEMRFFGGLTAAETAAAMKFSEGTVRNDWIFAQAWLRREFS